jgi:integration host factor subunit alpha
VKRGFCLKNHEFLLDNSCVVFIVVSTKEVIMTKADIIEKVYERVTSLSKKEASELVDAVFESMKETLGEGENLKISGFGSFIVRKKTSRPGRNPKTGKSITISARKVLTFRPSQILKKALN